jgi:parallel beta-helix repeat protein
VASGAEAGFSAGDWIRVESADTYGPFHNAELIRVASTSSGTITLDGALASSIAYTTANSAVIAKMTMLENIVIRGGQIIGPGTGHEATAVHFYAVLQPKVIDTRFDNWDFKAMDFVDCVGPHADRCRVYGGTSASNGFYGVSMTGATQDGKMTGCYVYSCRHSVTSDYGGGITGVARRCIVEGNTCVKQTASGIDNHGNADDWTIVGNTIVDNQNEYGIQIRSPKCVVVGNVIRNSASNGIYLRNETAIATKYSVTGNQVYNAGQYGIYYSATVADGGGTTVDGVTISGNQISGGQSNDYIYCFTDTGTPLQNIVIANNVLTGTIRLENVSDVVVSGNRLGNLSTNLSAAIHLLGTIGVVRATITGNSIQYSASGASGIRVRTVSSRVLVSGNTCDLCSNGVILESTVTNCKVVNNDCADCTTACDISTGTGHIAHDNGEAAPMSVASAGTITLPQGRQVTVSGTSTVNYVTKAAQGRVVTLRNTTTLTYANNTGTVPTGTAPLLLQGGANYVPGAANAELTLCYDGTQSAWVEISRRTP